MEHTAICMLCDWSEAWTNEPASQAAAVWHIFESHLSVWQGIRGERAVRRDPRPETLGTKFKDWERQGARPVDRRGG